jgi:hypothetical protein
MTKFSGELPLTVVFMCSVGSPASAKVSVTASVFGALPGANRHFLRALSTDDLKIGSPLSILSWDVPEPSTRKRAVTVPCFPTARAAAG